METKIIAAVNRSWLFLIPYPPLSTLSSSAFATDKDLVILQNPLIAAFHNLSVKVVVSRPQ